MAQQKSPPGKSKTQDRPASEEARHLAEEAIDEIKHGNKEEGQFILGEARELDKKAADEVVKDQKKGA